MRILLASPASALWNERKHIPLGIGYLATVLRERGHQVGLYDACVEDEPLRATVQRHRYEVLGVSACTPLINDAWQMARDGKSLGLTTVLGGPHLTLMPKESLGPDHPEVDYVVQGEAEESVLEFVEALEGQRPFDAVHGLLWRRDGEILADSLRLMPDLDALPYPAHDLFKISCYTKLASLTDGLRYLRARSYTIMTSRGCPYKCTYCSKPITGHTWRPRSVSDVIGEWRWLVKDIRATEIGVTDDIWNLRLDRAKDLPSAGS